LSPTRGWATTYSTTQANESEKMIGYSHYWSRKSELDHELFIDAMRDCQAICERLEIPLGNWAGEASGPVFNEHEIAFNGLGAESCETFLVKQKLVHNDTRHDGCTTRQRPYDLPVMCCLVILKEYLGDEFIVRSDGTQSDWQPALDKIGEVFGPKFLARPFVLGE
jgi:hypothetical protein